MTTYTAPLREIKFHLFEQLKIQQYSDLPGFEDASEEMVNAILEEGAKLCEKVVHPINHSGDQEGCTRHADGSVSTPKGYKEAFNAYRDGGWLGLSFPTEIGGQGMPHVVGIAFDEMVETAGLAFAMYPGLTKGAIAAIATDGTDEQKAKYLPKMLTAEWTGTMNLTEPHCGTDLGMLRSKAEPQADGSYKISGTKIFISSGEHDLAENIIHLVLARLPDAPAGIGGISLFIVPKFMVNDDGSLGARNGVSCGSIEHKMGIHGNSTCVLNYDAATGFLIGEPNKGLKTMFIMMNAARLGVGLQGLSQSILAYQNAVTYAKDRIQGRALKDRVDNGKPADPIIVHPDVRRMLMEARAFNEAGRALVMWTALQLDLERKSTDEATRERSADLVGLLTPVIKGVLTDKGYRNATNAQQVYGGHGYIQEWGMDQFVRDARITMIYEGTNGIQALDLVGRKLGSKGGRAIRTFMGMVEASLTANADTPELADFNSSLKEAFGHLQQATMWLMQNGMANPNHAAGAATAYMHLMGNVVFGWLWLEMGATCVAALKAGGNGDADFYNHKIETGRFFMRRSIKETASLLAEVESGSDILMALPADAF